MNRKFLKTTLTTGVLALTIGVASSAMADTVALIFSFYHNLSFEVTDATQKSA